VYQGGGSVKVTTENSEALLRHANPSVREAARRRLEKQE
jgi:hypothetical protein